MECQDQESVSGGLTWLGTEDRGIVDVNSRPRQKKLRDCTRYMGGPGGGRAGIHTHLLVEEYKCELAHSQRSSEGVSDSRAGRGEMEREKSDDILTGVKNVDAGRRAEIPIEAVR